MEMIILTHLIQNPGLLLHTLAKPALVHETVCVCVCFNCI